MINLNQLENTSSSKVDQLYSIQTKYFFDICKKIKVQDYPFLHLEETNLFEPSFYQYMCGILPRLANLDSLLNDSSMIGGMYSDKRHALTIKDFHKGFNRINSKIKNKDELIRLYEWFEFILVPKLADLLDVDISIKTHDEFLYGIDLKGFSLHPHTDIPQKIMTVMVYMPNDDTLSHAGTNLLVLKDPTMKKSQKESDFNLIKTTKFIPNNTFAFKRSNISFHSVSKFDMLDERKFLIFTVVSNKIT